MINYYQPFLLPFLKPTSYRMPKNIRRTYFLSFEDGLWVILKKRNIPKGAVILIPDFYCMDVVDNIHAHGYTPVMYTLNSQLEIPIDELNQYIKQNSPRVIIIFHACGISRLTNNDIQTICASYPDTLVLEDAVHKLIDPQTLSLIHPNHYCMDSLRKVLPLPGSFLYQRTDSISITPDSIHREWGYQISVHMHFWLFRTVFIIGTLMKSSRIIQFAHEKTLKAHDDIVGDSDGGYTGVTLIPHIHAHLNFKKIQQLKHIQIELYEQYLDKILTKNSSWYRIRIPEEQKKDLHVFPIGISKNNDPFLFQHIEKYLHARGVIVWFKFPDSPWSKHNGILFLPLGFHIKKKDIYYIMETLKNTH